MEVMDILEFSGDNRWLSNFFPAEVELDGMKFPSVEHAYQAAKTQPALRALFQSCTAAQAKRFGRTTGEIRPDWEQVKVSIMRDLIRQKFAQGTDLGTRLQATGTGQIVEGNSWGDTFWGVCQGNGQNWLGRLLMEHRAALLTPNAGVSGPNGTWRAV